jgi:hypothetical protein
LQNQSLMTGAFLIAALGTVLGVLIAVGTI